MQKQTLAGDVTLSGVGVHTGIEGLVTLKPASADEGIQLVRVDEKNGAIPLFPDAVVNTTLCTKISNPDGVTVQTVEHLFSALHGMGVDAVRIEIEGPEVPILDGSALPWVTAMEKVGFETLPEERTYFMAPEATISMDHGVAKVVPDADVFEVSVSSHFPISGVDTLEGSWEITPDVYKKEIAPARTFCLMRDVERLREAGLIQGGSLDCAVVFEEDGRVLNPDGLRLPYEPLRHKILDAVGDLFLTGRPVRGRFHIPQAGHGVNNQLLRQLVA